MHLFSATIAGLCSMLLYVVILQAKSMEDYDK